MKKLIILNLCLGVIVLLGFILIFLYSRDYTINNLKTDVNSVIKRPLYEFKTAK